MKEHEWAMLPYGYMKPHEPWGNPEEMNFYLVRLCDLLRHDLGVPLFVTYGTQGKHRAPWHSKGLAVDACVDLERTTAIDVVLKVTRYPFVGVGLLPLANHHKCRRALGLHLDVRPQLKVAQPQARWIWVNWEQYPMDRAHLSKYGLLQ